CLELLFRPGVRDEIRQSAVQGLAKLEGKREAAVLLDAIRSQDHEPAARRDSAPQAEGVLFDLVRLLTGKGSDLAAVRGDLETLATGARQPVLRQLGFVALIAADGGPDKAWDLAVKS